MCQTSTFIQDIGRKKLRKNQKQKLLSLKIYLSVFKVLLKSFDVCNTPRISGISFQIRHIKVCRKVYDIIIYSKNLRTQPGVFKPK